MNITTRNENHMFFRELWVEEGKRAGLVIVLDFQMRLGCCEVHMAGIGGVETDPHLRKHGYMRHLMEDTVTYMQNEGYELSLLFGIPNFYTKFGYATCMANYECKVKTRDAEAANPGELGADLRSRALEERDLPELMAFYNRQNAGRTGTLVRTPRFFEGFHKGSWYDVSAEACLWEDAAGVMQAYAAWDQRRDAVRVIEVEAVDERLYPRLLRFFAEQAVAKRCEDVILHMPLDHPFAEFVQRFGSEWAISYPRHGEGMMRILHQEPLLTTLIPEFERRIADSPLAGYSGALVLQTDLATTRLTFTAGRLTLGGDGPAPVLKLSQDRLMQLLVGYRSPHDVLNDPQVQLTGDGELLLQAQPLLRTLFPRQHAYVWTTDHF